MRITPIQEEVIALMAAFGIEPTLKLGPAALVKIPQPYDDHWRDLHGGKPIKSNTMQALERAGMVEKRTSFGVRFWSLTDAGRAAVSDSQSVGVG